MIPNLFPPSPIQQYVQPNYAPIAPIAPVSPQDAVQIPGYPKSRFDGIPQFERKAPITVVRKYFPAPRIQGFSNPMNLPYPMPIPSNNEGMTSQVINDLTRALDRQQMSGEMQQLTNTLASTMLNTMVMANHQHDHDHEDRDLEDIHIHDHSEQTDVQSQEPRLVVHENHIYHHYEGQPPEWNERRRQDEDLPKQNEIHHHFHFDQDENEDEDEDEHGHSSKELAHVYRHHYHHYPKKHSKKHYEEEEEDNDNDDGDSEPPKSHHHLHYHHKVKQTHVLPEDVPDETEKGAEKPPVEGYGEMAAIVTSKLLQKLKAEHLINTESTNEHPIHINGPTSHPVEQLIVDEKTNTMTKVADPPISHLATPLPQVVPKVPLPQSVPSLPSVPLPSEPQILSSKPQPQVPPILTAPSVQAHIAHEEHYDHQVHQPVETISQISPAVSRVPIGLPPAFTKINQKVIPNQLTAPVISQPIQNIPIAHINTQPIAHVNTQANPIYHQPSIPLFNSVPIRPALTIDNHDMKAEGHDAAQVPFHTPDLNSFQHISNQHDSNRKNKQKGSSGYTKNNKKVQNRKASTNKEKQIKKEFSPGLQEDENDDEEVLPDRNLPINTNFIADDKADDNPPTDSPSPDDSSSYTVNPKNSSGLPNFDDVENDESVTKDDDNESEVDQGSSSGDLDSVPTKKLYGILNDLDSIDIDKNNDDSGNTDDLTNDYMNMVGKSSSKQKKPNSIISQETLNDLELLSAIDKMKKKKTPKGSSRVSSNSKQHKKAKGKENNGNLYQRVLNKAIQKAAHRLSNSTILD